MIYKYSLSLLLFSLLSISLRAAEPVKVQYSGKKVTVNNGDKRLIVNAKGSHLEIIDTLNHEPVTIQLSGTSEDGTFSLTTKNETTLLLNSLQLTSTEGAPIVLKNKKKVTIVANEATSNALTITACEDTLNNKSAVVWAKGKLDFAGKGTLAILATGKGCKGINAHGDINISDLALDVKTTGMYLDKDTTNAFGFPGGGFPGGEGFGGPPPFGQNGFNPDSIPEEVKKHFEEMMKQGPAMFGGGFPGGAPAGGFPGFPSGAPAGGFPSSPNDSAADFGGMPNVENADFGGMPMKQKFIGTTKGIKSQGVITINSGNLTVSTASRGAEGIEGKRGVTINGGKVYVKAVDDAINANATISFCGGETTAWSVTNDAVDANVEGGFPMFFGFGQQQNNDEKKEATPGIIISGGNVCAYSQVGPPEEGFDCDFAPILVSGGTALSIGAGMGDMPSVPTEATAAQPTILFIGVDFEEGKPVTIETKSGETLASFTAPFNFNRSSSLVTSPKFAKGETYILKSGGKSYEATLTQNFTTVRANN